MLAADIYIAASCTSGTEYCPGSSSTPSHPHHDFLRHSSVRKNVLSKSDRRHSTARGRNKAAGAHHKFRRCHPHSTDKRESEHDRAGDNPSPTLSVNNLHPPSPSPAGP